MLPASYLSHCVEGVSIWQSLGCHCESDHDPLSPLRHTPHQLSILHSDAGCGDAIHSILVVLPTGVGTRGKERHTFVNKTITCEAGDQMPLHRIDRHLLIEKGVMDRMSEATAPTLAASEAPYTR